MIDELLEKTLELAELAGVNITLTTDQVRSIFNGVKQLSARIAELEAAARWIPVEERLPGVDEANVVSGKKSVSITVIAIDKFEHATRAFCFLEDYEGIYKKGDWYSLDKMQAVNKIAYWMPLPQPSAVQE